MNAVGIDVSKCKSTATIRGLDNIVLMHPCDIPHIQSAINALIEQIRSLDGETTVCIEHTDRYYEPAVPLLYSPENWHVDCMCCKPPVVLTEHYQNWCRRKKL